MLYSRWIDPEKTFSLQLLHIYGKKRDQNMRLSPNIEGKPHSRNCSVTNESVSGP